MPDITDENLNVELRQMLALLHEQRDSEWVFPSPNRFQKPGESEKHIQDVKNAFRRAVRLSKIAPITFHQLRHTFCSRLANAGVPMPVIQDLAGHASITMTRRYTHSADERKQRLFELAKETQPVIILDTLRDFFDGDENSSTDTKPVVDALRKLRSLGATLILLAHPPKKGNSTIRGTGNIGQKSDVIYVMEKKELREREIITLSIPKKNRAGSTRFRLVFRYIFVPTPGGLRIILADAEEPENQSKCPQNSLVSKIVRYIRDHEGSNQEKIKQALTMGDRRLKDGLSEALESGQLKMKPGQAKERLWYLNELNS